MVERNRIANLAASISDGAAVNWDEAVQRASSQDEEARIRALRMVADIASVHWSMEAGTPRPEDAEVAPHGEKGAETEILIRWGSLEIVEEIGEGAFGEVFQAWDPRLDRMVALKLLKHGESEHENRSSTFLKEGRLLAGVHHRNVATVYGADAHDGRVGLWMELITGRTLKEVIENDGPLGAQEAAIVGRDLCRALAAVHTAGLVHGDIKAQNVMREEGGRIVLMDFGAGKRIADEDIDRSPLSGTPLYMAPETLRGESVTARSDIYSLGVLLYLLVSGSFPLRGRSLQHLLDSHARGKRSLLRDMRADLPEGFIQTVERALSPDPSARYATAGEFERALTGALGAGGLAATATLPRNAEAAADRVHRSAVRPKRIAVAGAGIALILILGGVILTKRDPRRPGSAAAPATTSAVMDIVSAPTPSRGELDEDIPPLDVRATLYRWGETFARPLATGDEIRRGDELHLDVEGAEPVYFYVLNLDRMGHAYVLFPLPESELTNPLPPGVRHRLPGWVTEEGSRKALRWSVDSAGGKDAFVLIAARQPLPEIEQSIDSVEHARLGGSAEISPAVVSRIRGIGTLVKRDEPPALDGSGAAIMGDAIEGVAERSISGGIWMEEIVLENPASH